MFCYWQLYLDLGRPIKASERLQQSIEIDENHAEHVQTLDSVLAHIESIP